MVSLFGDVGAVVIVPELRRLIPSNVCENGDSEDRRLGEASPESDGGRSRTLLFGVSTLFAPLERKKPNGASDDELESEVADVLRPDRTPCFSLSSCARPFLALCSPTSSRSGSVQITSHMVDGRLQMGMTERMGLKSRSNSGGWVRGQ